MRFLKTLLLAWFGVLFTLFAHAQTRFTIGGVVTNEKNEPIKSATVFLSGTIRIAGTTDDGEFLFNSVEPGNYVIIIKMLGYGMDRCSKSQNKNLYSIQTLKRK